MADSRIFAGPVIRRIRRREGATQATMAHALDISPSYLNLIERNQRPLSAALLLKLSAIYDIDPLSFGGGDIAGGVAGLRRRLSDPIFNGLEVDNSEIEEWLGSAPGAAAAFARLYDDRAAGGTAVSSAAQSESPSVRLARQEIERWHNHFADLDAMAEGAADELRLSGGDLYGAIAERLRVKHQIAIRILPADIMPDRLRRLDLHARQLQLSEMMKPASRTFQAAVMLGQIEARNEIDALTAGSELTDRPAERLFRRHLAHYFAAALVMPYARFLRACESTGYDLFLLQRRFGAGFEQVAHRLTTMQRVGARGLPFFMVRIDRAGQVSKRYSGASQSPFALSDARCPLWRIHECFARPGDVLADLIELEDGSRWATLSRSVQGPARGGEGPPARFAVAIGVDARMAAPLSAMRGIELMSGPATLAGLGCTQCVRIDCSQRSAPPAQRTLIFNERERGLSAFDFIGD